MSESEQVTRLVESARDGGQPERSRLYNVVYEELKLIARGVYGVGGPGETLQPTVLTAELFLEFERRFPEPPRELTESRRTFFRAVALAMRTIVRDHARAKSAAKRGGGQRKFALMESVTAQPARTGSDHDNMLALDDALGELERFNERWAEVVLHRFFAGRSIQQTAELMGRAESSVSRDWALAKAWLERYLEGPNGDEQSAT